MRRPPHPLILLPVACLLAVTLPFLRGLPGGMLLPDPLLLILFLAVPRHGWRPRRTSAWILCLGLLRAAVSAVSPFVAWAGYGLGVAMRQLGQRFLAEDRFPARLLHGALAALPAVLLDHFAAQRLGAPLGAGVSLARLALVALAWAAALAPPMRRREAQA